MEQHHEFAKNEREYDLAHRLFRLAESLASDVDTLREKLESGSLQQVDIGQLADRVSRRAFQESCDIMGISKDARRDAIDSGG